MKSFRFYQVLLFSLCILNQARADDATNPYIGGWALTLPGGFTGWLGVEPHGKGVRAQMLWGWGSVFKLNGARLDGDTLVLTRVQKVDSEQPNGKKHKVKIKEIITVTRDGDTLKLASVKPKADGSGEERAEFTGKRLPPMPPAPDLSQVKFGEPIRLFNGENLDGWRVVEPDAINGWSVHDGLLCNRQGEEGKDYANLRTVAEFEDFTLHAETRVPEGGQ